MEDDIEYLIIESLLPQHLVDRMGETVENSPYHRENSVLEHTKMALSWIVSIAEELGITETWDQALIVDAIVNHDIGKPDSEEILWSDRLGGFYNRYKGHEKLSARMYSNYNSDGTITNDYLVPLMIENHVPYNMSDDKLRALLSTLEYFGIDRKMFYTLCLADAAGRISDSGSDRMAGAIEWVTRCEQLDYVVSEYDYSKPNCYVLIGPSGVGKDTWINHHKNENDNVFCLDDVRCDVYRRYADEDLDSVEFYKRAFEYCNNNKNEFNTEVDQQWKWVLKNTSGDLYVNNTNLTKKARKRWINEAQRHGYNIVGVLFNSATFDDLVDRQINRIDKHVPLDVLTKQYYNMTLPIINDEVDDLILAK